MKMWKNLEPRFQLLFSINKLRSVLISNTEYNESNKIEMIKCDIQSAFAICNRRVHSFLDFRFKSIFQNY
ncbi:hypothetical protein V1477_014982 [Vespula maculifrons]|uniref:Reverse transcriptase n=1 Tax=Vespula maculifrons TaxID=7453 RepID=A0ABD2BIZ5_VESMC